MRKVTFSEAGVAESRTVVANGVIGTAHFVQRWSVIHLFEFLDELLVQFVGATTEELLAIVHRTFLDASGAYASGILDVYEDS